MSDRAQTAHLHRLAPSLQQIEWCCHTLSRNVQRNASHFETLQTSTKLELLSDLQKEIDFLRNELASHTSIRELTDEELDKVVRARLQLHLVIQFMNSHYHRLNNF